MNLRKKMLMNRFTGRALAALCMVLIGLAGCSDALHNATNSSRNDGGNTPPATDTGNPPLIPPPLDPNLQSITVSTPPSRTDFYVGEPLDTTSLAGIVVTGSYDNKPDENVTPLASFSNATTTAGTGKPVTVTVNGKTASFTINVYPVFVGNVANGNGRSDLDAAFSSASNNDIITIYTDQTITNGTNPSGKTITLKTPGTTEKKITHIAPGVMFNLSGGGTKLILDGYLTVDGAVGSDNGPNPLVKIESPAAMEMKGHSKITGGKNSPSTDGSYGGGVFVSYGSLEMNDYAEISGNTIIGDSTESPKRARGGGVFMEGAGATVTMNGSARISGNTAGGDGAYGGGVYGTSSTQLTMNDDAEISGNNAGANGANGGGVYMWGGSGTEATTTMNGNSTIKDNSANSVGGGVYMRHAKLNITDNVSLNTKIFNNSLYFDRTFGKQVFISSTGGTFLINGGPPPTADSTDAGGAYWN